MDLDELRGPDWDKDPEYTAKLGAQGAERTTDAFDAVTLTGPTAETATTRTVSQRIGNAVQALVDYFDLPHPPVGTV